jgi:kynurenine 3-monooxygenase
MTSGPQTVHIAGAGPTGALLAILLRRRGLRVVLFESRPDPRGRPAAGGRSINLALADRGIHALRAVGLYETIERDAVPMRGRMVHDRAGNLSLQPYGQRPEEVLLSISRHRLGQVLLGTAIEHYGVDVRFEHRLEQVDVAARTARVRDLATDRLLPVPAQPLIACDGAGSRLRRDLQQAGLIDAEEVELDHGYKELSIPAGPDGAHRMEREALHIWPRGGHMLIALPNTDGSFTATLFLPKNGPVSFQSLTAAADIEAFLRQDFPDVLALMPDRLAEFEQHPTGFLGTVYAAPWHHGGFAALVGDAAHAIVPFHGQGMNCCLEDCLAFDACVAGETGWEERFARFYAERKANTDAIAAMALENYLEMRAQVADPQFQLRRALALELEARHPGRFIPRYSMVMFHHEIPYATAAARGRIQTQLLEELTEGVGGIGDVDFARAAAAIAARLPPLDQPRSSVTKE